MITILSRIIHFGFKNFWRNAWLSAATVAIMVMALTVFASLILFGVITDHAVSSVQDKIDISVYFKTTTSEDQILSIKQSLESLPQVKNVDYISRDQALADFQQKHKNEPTITQAIAELNSNPLEASLNIKARQSDQYAAIAQYLSSNSSLAPDIDNISYYQNQDVINRLNSIINNVDRGGLVLTIILALIGSLMIFNTIWLATFSNRDEISIMRVVGASNALVRGPYVIEGIIAGAMSAVIALIVTAPLVYYVSPYIAQFVPGLNIFEYFYTHLIPMVGYLLLFGIAIGAVSSFIAVRRYLKN